MTTITFFMLTLLLTITGVMFWLAKEALELRDMILKLAVIVRHLDEQKQ